MERVSDEILRSLAVDDISGPIKRNSIVSDMAAELIELREQCVPVAWAQRSKTGLLRFIRYGIPEQDDLEFAQLDGDTIEYFARAKAPW